MVSNLPKSGKNRQRYKNPISLYYLSDVGVSQIVTPIYEAATNNVVCIRCS